MSNQEIWDLNSLNLKMEPNIKVKLKNGTKNVKMRRKKNNLIALKFFPQT